MKLSVSVPNDLWMAACEAVGKDPWSASPSQIVQMALRRLEQEELADEIEQAGGFELSVSFS